MHVSERGANAVEMKAPNGAPSRSQPPFSNSEPQDKPREAQSWPATNDGPWDLERLWAKGASPRSWIVEPLIEEGDQVLLAGEPKCGKSLLASQLALEIARGPGKLGISTPFRSEDLSGEVETAGQFRVVQKPKDLGGGNWRVLYVSLEMRPKAAWMRTAEQAKELGVDLLKPTPTRFPRADYRPGSCKSVLALDHVFEIAPGSRSMGITPKRERESNKGLAQSFEIRAKSWHALLKQIKPDLIIFDSLVQLHVCDENSNTEMRDVLQTVRELARIEKPDPKDGYRDIAHIIIHHTRKETGDYSPNGKDASSMRGASSIHSEADLAITITRRGPDAVSLRFSARHIKTPDDLPLRRVGVHFVGHLLPKKEIYAERVIMLLREHGPMGSLEFTAKYDAATIAHGWTEPSKKKNSWEKILNGMVAEGALNRTEGTRGVKTYSLPLKASEAETPTTTVAAAVGSSTPAASPQS